MDARKLIDRLADTALVRDEIAMQVQLGLPWLDKRGGELCISFKLHREDYDSGMIRCYAPQYEAVWVYPFVHAVLFRDLAYSDEPPELSAPLAELDGKWLLGIGAAYLDELYDVCSQVLTFREENGTVTDVVLRRYQELYRKTAICMRLQALYLYNKEA